MPVFFFLQLIIEIYQAGEQGNIHIKINYMKARLRQFQALEGETVPEKVYDIMKRDLQKRKISSSQPNIMEILKINKLTKYYNNVQQIYFG